MSANGSTVPSSQNGAGATQESGELSLRGRIKQKLLSSSPTALADRQKKRNFSEREQESIKVIGQHLRDLGLSRTAEQLSEESECTLDHPLAAKFRQFVLNGTWEEAHTTLEELEVHLTNPQDKRMMHQLLAEEKYLELLEGGLHVEALHCLRRELTKYHDVGSDERLRKLSTLMMFRDVEELHREANWSGVSGGSRQKLMEQLQRYLPPSVMLPPRRLQALFHQAILHQVDGCTYHCSQGEVEDCSLLSDHICSQNQLPSRTIHVLSEHKDEVWFVKFSNDGRRLASGSKDGELIIWNVEGLPRKLHSIKVQMLGIAGLSWSPDDSLILVSGTGEEKHVYIYHTQTGQLKARINKSSDDSLSSCSWQNSGSAFYCGGLKGHFYECSTEGAVMHSWEGVRVQAVATHPDTNEAIAADTHHRIRSYNFQEPRVTQLFQEEHSIMSMVVSNDGTYLLLNLLNQSIHLWNIKEGTFVQRYQGLTQGFYTIHSCFGGPNDSYIASGSEDNMVYIWSRKDGAPILKLEGHSRTVNCVSWNPSRHEMLASASDDGTVRIWGTKRLAECHKALATSLASAHEPTSLTDQALESKECTVEKEGEGDPLTASEEEEDDEEEDSYNESDNEEDSDEGDVDEGEEQHT